MVSHKTSINEKTSSVKDGAPCLPLPKPRADTDYVRESQFLLWLWKMIHEISYGFDYEQYLRDGVVLCRLMQNLAPDLFAKQQHLFEKGDDKQMKRENIRKFLDGCRRYGLNDDELFDVEDLLSMLDIPRVTKCLFSLGKHAAEKSGNDGKPLLGKPYDEWLTEQLDHASSPEEMITRIGNICRRAGMPLGDDVLVSHVNTEWLKEKLDNRRKKDAIKIKRPPRDPLVMRTPSKPLAELKAIFANDNSKKPEHPPLPPPPMIKLPKVNKI